MARGNLIGGIYRRPVTLGNFMHFAIVAVVLAKSVLSGTSQTEVVAVFAIYAVFAASFGSVLFTSPKPEK